MRTFVALYRGDEVAGARLVAATNDPVTVLYVSTALLGREEGRPLSGDEVLLALETGRMNALRAADAEAVRDCVAEGANSMDDADVGEAIRARRAELGMTAERLVARTNAALIEKPFRINEYTLAAIENGHAMDICNGHDLTLGIASALGMPPRQLGLDI